MEKALREVDKALEGKIEGLVSGSGFKPLVRTLNKLGHPVKDNIGAINDRVNAVTGPIREELDNLQKIKFELENFA